MRIALGIAGGACAALALVLGGCGGARASVAGKVIEGDISFVGAIDQADERLTSEGIEGATVTLSAAGEHLAKAVSNAKGDFRASLGEFKVISAPVDFVVTQDGYVAARGSLYAPPSDQRILVVLKRIAGSGSR